jgi:5-methylcytosine-specific restriction endonuclease McrA
LEASYFNYKKLPCCDKRASQCPVIKKKIGAKISAALKGRKLSEERKLLQSRVLKEQWNTGKRKISERTIEHAKQLHTYRDGSSWNKGLKNSQVPWNKGLKKQESPEILSRDDIAYSDFRKYRNRVSTRTKKIYEQHKKEINPTNLLIGKCGVTGAHQIDHIISVRVGFEQGIPIEKISSKENLQIITWEENIKKYDGKGKRKSN